MSVRIDSSNNIIIKSSSYFCDECDVEVNESEREECFPLCKKCYYS